MIVKRDCIYFKGDIPCKPHKEKGFHCSCKMYKTNTKKSKTKKILIIKLGALGDVIRTTPILRAIKKKYKNVQIDWLSLFPQAVPSMVNNKYGVNVDDISIILSKKYDIVYNFDKDRLACVLLNTTTSKLKRGFCLKQGKCAPYDKKAKHKYLTGIFDDYSKKNKKNYVQEIFEIAGLPYKRQEYLFDKPERISFQETLKKPIVGLNTGCGIRWPIRTWPQKHWIQLAKNLKNLGYSVILLGGAEEDAKNKKIAKSTGAFYPGYFQLKKFFGVLNRCDVIVTSVTMALHVGIALKKKIILLNNIFNKHEFELYGRGAIIQPPLDCVNCYKSRCLKKCMSLIKPKEVLEEINKVTNGK